MTEKQYEVTQIGEKKKKHEKNIIIKFSQKKGRKNVVILVSKKENNYYVYVDMSNEEKWVVVEGPNKWGAMINPETNRSVLSNLKFEKTDNHGYYAKVKVRNLKEEKTSSKIFYLSGVRNTKKRHSLVGMHLSEKKEDATLFKLAGTKKTKKKPRHDLPDVVPPVVSRGAQLQLIPEPKIPNVDKTLHLLLKEKDEDGKYTELRKVTKRKPVGEKMVVYRRVRGDDKDKQIIISENHKNQRKIDIKEVDIVGVEGKVDCFRISITQEDPVTTKYVGNYIKGADGGPGWTLTEVETDATEFLKGQESENEKKTSQNREQIHETESISPLAGNRKKKKKKKKQKIDCAGPEIPVTIVWHEKIQSLVEVVTLEVPEASFTHPQSRRVPGHRYQVYWKKICDTSKETLWCPVSHAKRGKARKSNQTEPINIEPYIQLLKNQHQTLTKFKEASTKFEATIEKENFKYDFQIDQSILLGSNCWDEGLVEAVKTLYESDDSNWEKNCYNLDKPNLTLDEYVAISHDQNQSNKVRRRLNNSRKKKRRKKQSSEVTRYPDRSRKKQSPDSSIRPTTNGTFIIDQIAKKWRVPEQKAEEEKRYLESQRYRKLQALEDELDQAREKDSVNKSKKKSQDENDHLEQDIEEEWEEASDDGDDSPSDEDDHNFIDDRLLVVNNAKDKGEDEGDTTESD